MTTVTTPPVRLNLACAASAFENWENDFRANPGSFYTAEETAAMAVATISEARAIHFLALLRDLPSVDTPPAAGEIWPGQGGRYICTIAASDGLPERHLVFGTSEAEDLTFGPYLDVPGAKSMVDGRANTAALLASGSEHPAAAWATAYTEDGHTDFHLPSRVELVLAHAHAKEHFSEDGYYWSSTQTSRGYAFVQDFEGGSSGWDVKDSERRVRACRWIHLTA
jgi:hypothetical protein